jgi:ABC-2 type transport system ATP-binding protein
MSEPAIQAHELVRDFKTVRALDHLSLEVPTGIVFGFLGPNGAGKTTAIRTFLGLVEPNAGQARVLGLDIRTQGERIRERSGALLEHNGLYERLTAEQNLDFYGRAWHMSAADRRVRIRELLMQFGLWDRRAEVVEKWSRGMKQKLAVARTVLHHPPLVFLDEPTAGLDPVASAALREDLAELARAQGVTIFLTTHNLSEAERLCALIGVIRGGRLVALGTPAELREGVHAPRVRFIGRGLGDAVVESLGAHANVERVDRVGDDVAVTLRDQASAAPLIAMLVAAGVELEEVRRERATLEETFLELVTSDRASSERRRS